VSWLQRKGKKAAGSSSGGTAPPTTPGSAGEPAGTALAEGLALKEEGNKLFKDAEYYTAIKQYKRGILRTRGLFSRSGGMAMFGASRGLEPLTDEEESSLVHLTQSFHANLSACYLKLGEWDKAVKYALVVLDADPGNVKSMLRLGQAYHMLGDLVA
jgi:tetratricopeptide (TPR) repeat protein